MLIRWTLHVFVKTLRGVQGAVKLKTVERL